MVGYASAWVRKFLNFPVRHRYAIPPADKSNPAPTPVPTPIQRTGTDASVGVGVGGGGGCKSITSTEIMAIGGVTVLFLKTLFNKN